MAMSLGSAWIKHWWSSCVPSTLEQFSFSPSWRTESTGAVSRLPPRYTEPLWEIAREKRPAKTESTAELLNPLVLGDLLNIFTFTYSWKQVPTHVRRTGTVSKNQNSFRISTKFCNVFLYPAQSHHLILECHISTDFFILCVQVS